MMSEDDPGPSFFRRIPPGDDRERDVCARCGFVSYDNPKIVVGSVVESDDGRILMCRRAIQPRQGFWTLPAGFLEQNETVEEGARREAREEALADIRIEGLLAVYSVARISQVQLMFRARLAGGFAAGPESLEVALFALADIPRAELAFPTVHWALDHYAAYKAGAAGPFYNPAP